ncbi:sugar transferase [Sunxiuqinia indica]|uniref:sugar transferase n=1 Tax=Sunxiuqinia indica TaxID=2692584 RepID=UPI00135C1F8C|nr:sugar transferase [Sunxiuqinia indica]
MLHEREYAIQKISIIIQVLLTMGCYTLIWWLDSSSDLITVDHVSELKNNLVVIALLWFLLLDQFGLGDVSRKSSYANQFKSNFKAISIGMGVLFAVNVISNFSVEKLLIISYFGILNLLALTFFKYFFLTLMRFLRRRGYGIRQAMMIVDEQAIDYIEETIHRKDWGYSIRAIMTNSKLVKEKYQDRYNVIPKRSNLKAILDRETIDEVMYCNSDYNHDEITRFISECNEVGVSFHHYTGVISKLRGKRSAKTIVSLVNQKPFVSYMSTPNDYIALKLKNVFDFFFSLFVIILSSPIYLVLAIAIKLGDGGPVFFKQERVGLNGRRFGCYKFRTMVVNAEALKASLMGQNEQEGPVFKITSDPRVTRVGHFLRKTSLDELPQFINVLRGEMSVVGPRPPIPAEVEKYKRWQVRRLSMKPGITCIWQVSGRNDIKFEEWMKLDMKYIDNWSLTKDLVLIFKTVKVVFVGTGK